MQLSVGLLLVSALVTIASARSTPHFVSSQDKPAQDLDLQRRNLDAHDQDERQQSDYYTKNGLEKGIHDVSFGDVQRTNSVTNCIVNIAKTGIKRSFSKCKAYIKEIMQFCRSTNGKKTHKDACQSASMSISIAINECDVLAEKRKPVTELCKTLIPPKTSKSSCKAGQLFGQVPGSSTTPVCFDAPQDKQSKTQVLPLRMYRPYQRYTAKNPAQLQANHFSAEKYNHHNRKPGALVEVHTLPIGQGDCTVIYCNGGQHAILFDCGARGGNILDTQFIQSYFEFKDVSSITVMISHGHSDHYNRIPYIFHTSIQKLVKEIIVGGPKQDYSAKTIANWLASFNKVEYLVDSKVYIYQFCKNVEFKVIVGGGKDKNQRGMVMKMSCKSCKSSLLFSGDMEGQAAEVMARRSKDTKDAFYGILDVTHYKMAHHGASRLANKKDWLGAISPIEVHVSHMYNGRYGHPSCEAIDILKGLGTTSNIANTPHTFTCIEKRNDIAKSKPNECEKNEKYPNRFVCRNKIQHRIYSTAPTSDKICVIVLSFKEKEEATTDIYCGKPGKFLDDPIDDADKNVID